MTRATSITTTPRLVSSTFSACRCVTRPRPSSKATHLTTCFRSARRKRPPNNQKWGSKFQKLTALFFSGGRMGASGWSYYVPYQGDVNKALQDLRQQVF